MAGSIELQYGGSGQTTTFTLNSLGSASVRASTAIDNSTTLFEDILVQLTIASNSAGVSATGIVNVYATGSTDGGATYGEGATGTDGSLTLSSPPNLTLIATINVNQTSHTYKSSPISVARAFGGTLPQKIVIVVQNSSGAALAASGNSMTYQGVNHQYT